MNRFKAYQKSYFKALFKNGGGELGERCDTIEEMRQAIDKANQTFKTGGYKQMQYIIVYVQWSRVFDDNEMFLSEHEGITRMEIYPETLTED